MAPKRRRRQPKKAQTESIEVDKEAARRKEFQEILNALDKESTDYVQQMHREYKCARQAIEKMYDEKLSEMPEKYRNMTISEYTEDQERLNKADEIMIDDADVCEAASIVKKRHQLFSASKTKTKPSITGKKLNTNRRRSMSCPTGKGRKVPGLLQSCVTPLPAFSRISRVLSESSLNTPVGNRQKFNPRTPIPSAFLRKPRIGEVISCQQVFVSASGSPVQNMVENESDAPTVILKLGRGRFISIAEDSDTGPRSCIKELDEKTKLQVREMLKDIL